MNPSQQQYGLLNYFHFIILNKLFTWNVIFVIIKEIYRAEHILPHWRKQYYHYIYYGKEDYNEEKIRAAGVYNLHRPSFHPVCCDLVWSEFNIRGDNRHHDAPGFHRHTGVNHCGHCDSALSQNYRKINKSRLLSLITGLIIEPFKKANYRSLYISCQEPLLMPVRVLPRVYWRWLPGASPRLPLKVKYAESCHCIFSIREEPCRGWIS